jgi:hypothetical protein
VGGTLRSAIHGRIRSKNLNPEVDMEVQPVVLVRVQRDWISIAVSALVVMAGQLVGSVT